MLRAKIIQLAQSARSVSTSAPMYRRWQARRVKIRIVPEPLLPASVDNRPEIDPLMKCEDDQPIDGVKNPYATGKHVCILCKYSVKPDYKNPRLLSQFVSSFSGRLYEKHVTGLCEYQQRLVRNAIVRARQTGLMPIIHKDPRYLNDPKLFDPMRPTRANPF